MSLVDGQVYTLNFKPAANLNNLKKLNEVVVKGNLTWVPSNATSPRKEFLCICNT